MHTEELEKKMMERNQTSHPGEAEERLGNLIRQAYRIPDRDRDLSVDLTARILSRIDEKPRQSLYERFTEIFRVTPVWVPAGAFACLLLGLGILFFMAEPSDEKHDSEQMATLPHPTPGVEQDPLGADFFTFEKYEDEPITVDLADGWDAMTIEDEDSNTALVYFYSAGEVKNSTGGIQ
ncbi:MAG: hypothetical protein UZ16_OP3001001133 [Candidatus Hinthialibacteria bacterium OLB16]|nr:MAG: hypothetical protein UZ16_OP3001001133 [Candidatus Hinthialibacteria bacterium OLB16]